MPPRETRDGLHSAGPVSAGAVGVSGKTCMISLSKAVLRHARRGSNVRGNCSPCELKRDHRAVKCVFITAEEGANNAGS